jgi:hypothetical protein
MLATNAFCRGKNNALQTRQTASTKNTIRTTNFFGDVIAIPLILFRNRIYKNK